MPTEIEIKLKVDSHAAARERLRAAGAVCAGKVLEINRIFDDAERRLLAGGSGLRVREARDETGRMVRGLLTFKGPKSVGPIKSREEIECVVDDPAAACDLVEALGFQEFLLFEKRRESWHFGECEVELDEVPHLGCFIEIEGPDEATIQRARSELGLESAPLVAGTYIGLLVRHCGQQHSAIRSIRFVD